MKHWIRKNQFLTLKELKLYGEILVLQSPRCGYFVSYIVMYLLVGLICLLGLLILHCSVFERVCLVLNELRKNVINCTMSFFSQTRS